MGILSKFESTFSTAKVVLPKRIKINEEINIPKIVVKDTRLTIPTEEEKSYINTLMLAHKLEDYRRSKTEIVLLPEVNIEITKIIDIDREKLKSLKIERRNQ